MTKRIIKKSNKPKQVKRQPAKNTPFGDSGAIIAKRMSKMLPFGDLTGVGRWLGTGIGSIFGSGDYEVVGGGAEYNVLSGSIPKFSTTHSTNIVCHREYIGDILGTTAFTNQSFPINPGMFTTFPWLSTVAEGYQEYRIHGMVFEFNSLITDYVTGGAPGVVVMATNYNSSVPVYTSRAQMENSEFSKATKPTKNLVHMVECKGSEVSTPILYIRSGTPASNQDLRLYDHGTFQLATQGNPNQILGELWVSYCVEFFKPQIPSTIGGIFQSFHTQRTATTNGAPLGTSSTFAVGSLLNPVITATAITFGAQPGAIYHVECVWFGTSAAVTFGTNTLTGLITTPVNFSTGLPYVSSPANGSTSVSLLSTEVFTCNSLVAGNVTIALSGYTIPAGSVDIIITQLDNSVTR